MCVYESNSNTNQCTRFTQMNCVASHLRNFSVNTELFYLFMLVMTRSVGENSMYGRY